MKALKVSCQNNLRESARAMPQFHVHASYIKQGGRSGSASSFAQYLRRDDRAHTSRMHRYVERDGAGHGKDDLVVAGHANLPAWAED